MNWASMLAFRHLPTANKPQAREAVPCFPGLGLWAPLRGTPTVYGRYAWALMAAARTSRPSFSSSSVMTSGGSSRMTLP